jgi:hypothetical protein
MLSFCPNLDESTGMAIWGWLGGGAAVAGVYVLAFSLATAAHRADDAEERARRDHPPPLA